MRTRIYEYLCAHEAEMLNDLERLVAIPSVQGVAEEHMPFGRECALCLDTAAELYRINGFEVTTYPESGYALATYGTGEESIGFFAHSDVVPVVPEDWTRTKPFDMLVDGDLVFGRGVGDNKAAVIGVLYLLKAVRDLEIPLKNRIIVFIGSNEETGMRDIASFAKEQNIPKFNIVPDSGFPFSLGELGILRFDVCAGMKLHDVVSLQGGTAYNIVMPSLVCKLRRTKEILGWAESLAEEWLTVTANEETVSLAVNGIAAHAASPTLGVSAFIRLASILKDCEAICEEDRAQFAELFLAIGDTYGTALGIAEEDESLGRLTCANGMVRMEDNCLVFSLDIRHGRDTSMDKTINAIEQALKSMKAKIRVHYSAPAFSYDSELPSAQALLRAYREASGDQEGKPFYMTGGTYCKHLPNAFATGVCFGEADAHLPEGYGHAHQADECISVEAWKQGLSILAVMLSGVDQVI